MMRPLRGAVVLFYIALYVAIVLAQDLKEPRLSTEEGLQLRVLQLETQLELAIAQANACAGELGQYRAKVASMDLTEKEAALKRTIEAAHPGFTVDAKTGALTSTASKPTSPTGKP